MDNMKLVVLIALIFAIVALSPIALIWSVNTLFHAGIAYTFKTWIAAACLSTPFAARFSGE